MSCRDVCISADYDGSAEFYSEHKTRRAGKPHTCCECADLIMKGDVHHYASGKWDGDFTDYRTCAPCAEIREVFGCEGWTFTMLWDDVRDQIFPKWQRNELTIIDCLARLRTDEAIAKARAQYAKYLEDQE